MIHEFITSWSLFHNTYLVGWLIAVLLPTIGVLVTVRDQVFIGAAVSQASLLGIATAMWLASTAPLAGCEWCQSDSFHSVVGGAFAILGALFTAHGGRVRGQSYEAITGWLFLFSSSAAILIVAHSPHGLEEVQRLLSSTIIGATALDVGMFALLTVATLAALQMWRRRLLLVVLDPEMAAAVGVRVRFWDRLLSIWLGIAVGLSIHVAGLVYTFGSLVLPALIAREVCREVRVMFLAAPLIAVVTSVVAFVLANSYDYPPGQVAVTVQAVPLAVIWIWRRLSAP